MSSGAGAPGASSAGVPGAGASGAGASGEGVGAGAAAGARVTLLTRPQCHLCGPVREVVIRVCADLGVSWSEADVDSTVEWREEYGDQIPVVLVDGRFVASRSLAAENLRAEIAAG